MKLTFLKPKSYSVCKCENPKAATEIGRLMHCKNCQGYMTYNSYAVGFDGKDQFILAKIRIGELD